MKTNRLMNWMAIGAVILTMAAVVPPEKSFTGTVVSVDPQARMLKAKGILFGKQFNLGATCACTLLDNSAGTIGDLRPGQKVTVSYQDAQGVLIADRVAQQPMRDEGMVKAMDPAAHTLTVHVRGSDRTFQIADDCIVVLRDDKSGALADIQPGNHVTVTYETPDDRFTARQIAQTSIQFTGMLTAIDLGDKTLKAKAGFTSKKFNVADDCAIIINGKTDGQLSDLKPNDRLVFSYDEINGINLVNRIAPAEARMNPVATSTSPRSGD